MTEPPHPERRLLWCDSERDS